MTSKTYTVLSFIWTHHTHKLQFLFSFFLPVSVKLWTLFTDQSCEWWSRLPQGLAPHPDKVVICSCRCSSDGPWSKPSREPLPGLTHPGVQAAGQRQQLFAWGLREEKLDSTQGDSPVIKSNEFHQRLESSIGHSNKSLKGSDFIKCVPKTAEVWPIGINTLTWPHLNDTN